MEENNVVQNTAIATTTTTTQTKTAESEPALSLIDLWVVLKKYFFRILLLTVIATAIAFAYLSTTVKSTYTAQATIILNPAERFAAAASSSQSSQLATEYNYVQYGKTILPSVVKFIKTNSQIREDVNKAAAADMALPEDEQKHIEYMRSSPSVSSTTDELQIFISYTTTTSGEYAVGTVNQIVESIKKVSNKMTEIETKEKDENGNYITKQVYVYGWAEILNVDDYAQGIPSPNKRWPTYTLLAFLVFFVLFYVYYLIVSLLDDTVKSKKEIESLTGFNVMAYIDEIDTGKTHGKSGKKKGKRK